jgi:hypothetical protein
MTSRYKHRGNGSRLAGPKIVPSALGITGLGGGEGKWPPRCDQQIVSTIAFPLSVIFSRTIDQKPADTGPASPPQSIGDGD